MWPWFPDKKSNIFQTQVTIQHYPSIMLKIPMQSHCIRYSGAQSSIHAFPHSPGNSDVCQLEWVPYEKWRIIRTLSRATGEKWYFRKMNLQNRLGGRPFANVYIPQSPAMHLLKWDSLFHEVQHQFGKQDTRGLSLPQFSYRGKNRTDEILIFLAGKKKLTYNFFPF